MIIRYNEILNSFQWFIEVLDLGAKLNVCRSMGSSLGNRVNLGTSLGVCDVTVVVGFVLRSGVSYFDKTTAQRVFR